jgi:hypothetical protein
VNGQGSGNIPPVAQGPTQSAPDGEVFWFLTTGSVNNGMPAWGSLPEQQRWQIVAYLKSLKNSKSGEKSESSSPAAVPVSQDSQVYVVLTSQNGVRLPDNALDHVGVPGIVVKGRVIEADGLRALAVEKLKP